MRHRYVWIDTLANHVKRFPTAPAPWTLDGWEGEGLYNVKSGAAMMQEQRIELCAPQVMRDTPEYLSPVTGRPIDGRAARREDLKRNNCYEIDPPRRPRGFKNPAFAAKYGKRVNEHCDVRDLKAEKARLAAIPR